MRPLRADEGQRLIELLDERRLPHEVVFVSVSDYRQVAQAIAEMWIRGAPLIGACAAYGVWLASLEDPTDAGIESACSVLAKSRPTAVNLSWALARMKNSVVDVEDPKRPARLFSEANAIVAEDVDSCRRIGEHALALLRRPRGERLNLLTHCNAGWLACIEWGTATAAMYLAKEAGIALHVYVSETRPRNQGARLTAWELEQAGISHHVVADNACGWLIAEGMVDACIVGTDRTARNGDVANKIGTYLKALACKRHNVPFYVAAPSSSIDFACESGADIPIEFRSEDEVLSMWGMAGNEIHNVRLSHEGARAVNPGFDVTPADLITALITERGACEASEKELLELFPERS